MPPHTESINGSGMFTSVTGGSATAASTADGATSGIGATLGNVVLGSVQSGVVNTNIGGSGGTLGQPLALSSIYVGSKVSAADLSAYLSKLSGGSSEAVPTGSGSQRVALGPPYGQLGSFPGR